MRKKTKIAQIPVIFNDYLKQFSPRTNLDSEDFDELFSPILNITETYFKIMQERGFADFY